MPAIIAAARLRFLPLPKPQYARAEIKGVQKPLRILPVYHIMYAPKAIGAQPDIKTPAFSAAVRQRADD